MAEETSLVKIPKGTPPLAVGVVAVIAALIGWYMAATPQINSYLQNSREVSVKHIETENSTLSSVLRLVESNSSQILEISKSLGIAQVQVANLTNRVSTLERQLSVTEESLKACELKISKCKG
jgi:ACT domain-containing protein